MKYVENKQLKKDVMQLKNIMKNLKEQVEIIHQVLIIIQMLILLQIFHKLMQLGNNLIVDGAIYQSEVIQSEILVVLQPLNVY